MENEVKQTEVKPQETTSNNTILVILGIISSVFLIALCVYVLYRDGVFSKATYDNDNNNTQVETTDTTQSNTESQTTTETTENSQPTTVAYEGDTVTATLPNDIWNIVEYYDGDGTDSLPEGYTTYTGLTALDITKNNTKIFSLKAVSGIGFVGCSDYAQFDDTNPGHLSQQESINDEIGGDMTLHDYTDTKYSEFEWLGITFRRVEKNYYYDTQEGNNYFESPCVTGLLTLEGLSYEDADGYKGEAYFYGPTEDATLSDLEIVDSILGSMELID